MQSSANISPEKILLKHKQSLDISLELSPAKEKNCNNQLKIKTERIFDDVNKISNLFDNHFKLVKKNLFSTSTNSEKLKHDLKLKIQQQIKNRMPNHEENERNQVKIKIDETMYKSNIRSPNEIKGNSLYFNQLWTNQIKNLSYEQQNSLGKLKDFISQNDKKQILVDKQADQLLESINLNINEEDKIQLHLQIKKALQIPIGQHGKALMQNRINAFYIKSQFMKSKQLISPQIKTERIAGFNKGSQDKQGCLNLDFQINQKSCRQQKLIDIRRKSKSQPTIISSFTGQYLNRIEQIDESLQQMQQNVRKLKKVMVLKKCKKKQISNGMSDKEIEDFMTSLYYQSIKEGSDNLEKLNNQWKLQQYRTPLKIVEKHIRRSLTDEKYLKIRQSIRLTQIRENVLNQDSKLAMLKLKSLSQDKFSLLN